MVYSRQNTPQKIVSTTTFTLFLGPFFRSDKLFLLGDFNARVGADSEFLGDIIGQHGIANISSNGLRLLTHVLNI